VPARHAQSLRLLQLPLRPLLPELPHVVLLLLGLFLPVMVLLLLLFVLLHQLVLRLLPLLPMLRRVPVWLNMLALALLLMLISDLRRWSVVLLLRPVLPVYLLLGMDGLLLSEQRQLLVRLVLVGLLIQILMLRELVLLVRVKLLVL
jgi:hypothetical protein